MLVPIRTRAKAGVSLSCRTRFNAQERKAAETAADGMAMGSSSPDPNTTRAIPPPPSAENDQRAALQQERDRWARRGKVAAVWLLGGGLITIVTYTRASSSPGGGTYVVMFGPIVFGTVRLVEAIAHIARLDGKLPNAGQVPAGMARRAPSDPSRVRATGPDNWAEYRPLPPISRQAPAPLSMDRRLRVLIVAGATVVAILVAVMTPILTGTSREQGANSPSAAAPPPPPRTPR